ncbi:MAG: methionine--tRNA ligase [Candidatus Moranbacteria bacterium]|nr:methionine--tRNA ligase [Candidatus Moranbacteria bacterium]
MEAKKPFFITTPIYYANGLPHIGHAYTTVAADVVARAKRLTGQEVIFSTGTDEHGAKIAEKALLEGKNPQEFVDGIAKAFEELWKRLDISHDHFIRTTDAQHKNVVTNVLTFLYDKGAIYKGEYEGLYCVGCEQFKMESDLVGGKCPDHNRIPEKMVEESYMLKMTEYQEALIQKIESDELCIRPVKYKKEILSFLKGQKLEDISLSRKNVAWGIPLPFDETHTTYVWVDAFLNYLTVLGWDGKSEMPQTWPADVQFIGKDILRVHATIWQILLLHLGFPVTKTLFTHGHILSGGKKMSKTLGNVISIDEMLETFGVDGTRYLLLSGGTFGEDMDLTPERMKEKYNADLANGLGNLVSRVLKLSERLQGRYEPGPGVALSSPYIECMENIELSQALELVFARMKQANEYMSQEEPWKLAGVDQERFEKVIRVILADLEIIAFSLNPFLPETAKKIQTALREGKTDPLFQRI